MQKSKSGLPIFLTGLLYCCLLAAGNLFIYEQQKATLYRDYEAQQIIHLHILADLTREGLITQNYAFIEWVINRWGREFHQVVSLSLENTQGYALIKYQRSVPSQADMQVNSKKITMHDATYMFRISADTSELERKLGELLLQLFLISTGATILLVIMLWYVFLKFSVQPLTEEIKRRKTAEDKLEAMQAES